jgi:quinol monooxygenase YgiN
VFVVVGVWELDPALDDVRRGMFPDLVAGVGRAPGLVKGYWSAEVGDPHRSHTFILFEDRASAEAFAADVRGNLVNQARAGVSNLSLDLAEISATT